MTLQFGLLQQQPPVDPMAQFYTNSLQQARQLQLIQAARGSLNTAQDAMPVNVAQGQLQNYLDEQRKYASVPRATLGELMPDGSMRAGYNLDASGNPTMTNGQYDLGPQMTDYNGQPLQSQAALANQAAQFRASKGFDPGQQMPDQIQAQIMTGLAQNILTLPEGDRQLAYERAMGLAAGKGVIEMNQAPPWDQGGRELTLQIANLNNQAQLGAANLRAQGYIAAAEARKGAFNPNPTAPTLDQQLKQAQLDEKMGNTGGPGQPVGAPIAQRAATTYTAASQAINHIDALANLLSTGQVSPLIAKVGSAIGANAALSPANQQFNLLTNSLNDTIKRMGGDTGNVEKSRLDSLSKLLPTIGDTDETKAAKLAMLKSETNNIRTALDPSGHIATVLRNQGAVSAQPTPAIQLPNTTPASMNTGTTIPSLPATIQATNPGLTAAQWGQIVAMRTMQQAAMQQHAQPMPIAQPAQGAPPPAWYPQAYSLKGIL